MIARRPAAAILLVTLLSAGAAFAETSRASREDGEEKRRKSEPALTLDVKDADVRAILEVVAEQCGIRNLIVDRDVTGKGTFLFEDVPCSTGIPVILRSLGLGAEFYSSSVVRVKP